MNYYVIEITETQAEDGTITSNRPAPLGFTEFKKAKARAHSRGGELLASEKYSHVLVYVTDINGNTYDKVTD